MTADLAPQRGPAALASRAARPRLILAGLLTAIVIAGIAAGPPLGWRKSWQGPWHDHGDAIAIVLEAVLAALLVWLWVLHRARPAPGWPASRLRMAQLPVIGGVMLVAGIYLARHLPLPKPHAKPPPPRQLPPAKPTPSPVPVRSSTVSTAIGPIVEYVLLALLTIAVIGVLVVLVRRLQQRHLMVDADLVPEDDEGEMLRRAVEAGRAALRAIPESRRAIIACYLAMEGSLGLAGAARGPAETPDELLARASTIGLLHGEAAARLTALFYGARFSARQVPDSARQEALTALDAILAELAQATRARERTAAGNTVTP
ncbi:MAG TPA: DUF4129 domain-containing protein [Streptosporangiaceae bacterium]|nr:DUF4129 domain-containing protein [Streptosporangiaceae bacterium]